MAFIRHRLSYIPVIILVPVIQYYLIGFAFLAGARGSILGPFSAFDSGTYVNWLIVGNLVILVLLSMLVLIGWVKSLRFVLAVWFASLILIKLYPLKFW